MQIEDLIEGYETRLHEKIRPIVFSHGDRILMYLRSDPFASYTKQGKPYYLKDNENRYEIRKQHGVVELIQRDYSNETDIEGIIPLTVMLD